MRMRAAIAGGLAAALLALATTPALPAAASGAPLVPAPPFGPSLEEAVAAGHAPSSGSEAKGAAAHDAEILYSGTSIRVADGRLSVRTRTIRRLLTDAAIAHHGDVRVPFDTTLQALEIHEMRTWTREGRITDAEARAFNRVTPERVSRCADRAAAQEMVVSRLGVERGCVVVLDYTIADRVAFRPWYEGEVVLSGEEPVRAGEILLSGLESLKASLRGIDPALVAAHEGPGSDRRWTYGPLPGTPLEDGTDPRGAGSALAFTTCGSWDQVLAFAEAAISAGARGDTSLASWSRLPMPAGRRPIDDADVLAKAAALIGREVGAADDLPLDWLRSPRPAAVTRDVRCGNLLDRAVLAHAALTAMGSTPRILLVPGSSTVRGDGPGSLPRLMEFTDIWMTLADEGRVLSIAQGAAADAPDPGWAAQVLTRRDGTPAWISVAPEAFRSEVTVDLRPGRNDRMVGDVRVRVTGAIDRLFDSGDPTGMLDDLASGLLEDGKVVSRRVERSGERDAVLACSIEGRTFGESLAVGLRRWPLPAPPGIPECILPRGLDLTRTERATPLSLRASLEEELRVHLRLPEGAVALVLPREVDRTAGQGMVLRVATTRDMQGVRIERRFSVPEVTIPPDAYPGFRDLLLRRVRAEGMSVLWGTGDPHP